MFERISNKKNNSDGRDKWAKAHQDGVEACRKSPLSWKKSNPYEEDPVAKKEWLQGWAEELERLQEKLSKLLGK